MPNFRISRIFSGAGHKVNPPHFMSRTPEKSAKNRKTVNNQNSVSVPAQLYSHIRWKFNVKMSSLDLKLWAPEPVFVNLLRSPGIDPSLAAGTTSTTLFVILAKSIPRKLFLGSLCTADFENLEIIFLVLGKLLYGPFLGIFWGGPDFFDPSKYPFQWHKVICPPKKFHKVCFWPDLTQHNVMVCQWLGRVKNKWTA